MKDETVTSTSETIQTLARTHKLFREAVLFLICVAFAFLMTSESVVGPDNPDITKNHDFFLVAIGFVFLFLIVMLWQLTFRLWPTKQALGICALSLLTISLPFVVYFADRKAVHHLRANGITPKLRDLLRM